VEFLLKIEKNLPVKKQMSVSLIVCITDRATLIVVVGGSVGGAVLAVVVVIVVIIVIIAIIHASKRKKYKGERVRRRTTFHSIVTPGVVIETNLIMKV